MVGDREVQGDVDDVTKVHRSRVVRVAAVRRIVWGPAHRQHVAFKAGLSPNLL